MSGAGIKCSSGPLSYEHFVPTVRTKKKVAQKYMVLVESSILLLRELFTKDSFRVVVRGTDSHIASSAWIFKFVGTASWWPRLLSRFYTCVARKNDSYKAHSNSGESSHKMT